MRKWGKDRRKASHIRRMNPKNIRLVWRNSGNRGFQESREWGTSGVEDIGGYAGVLHRWATGTCRRAGLRGSPGKLGKAENKGQLYTRKIAAWAAREGE